MIGGVTIDALATALSALIGAVVGAWVMTRRGGAEVRKLRADADSVSVDAAHDVIGDLRLEVERLQKRVSVLEDDVRRESERANESTARYQRALDRIVELETRDLAQQRQMSELRLQVRKLEIELAEQVNSRGGLNGNSGGGAGKPVRAGGDESARPDAEV